ncbi:MAG TPA: phosphotransferase [Gaiellales bacterium]|nr:phosphotransferase [Gaiellales bacterium]
MPQWSPEIVVDSALARRLIAGRFPELDGVVIEPLGEGWDSTVWLVDSRWVFRFPRREVVVPGFLRETEVLPVLAPDLPLPVPVAAFRGEPGAEFPWPWSGSPFLPGREPADAAPSDHDRVGHGVALGRFLRALHDVDPDTVTAGGAALPVDPVRRADMPHRVADARRRCVVLQRAGLWISPPELATLLDRAEQLDPPVTLAVVHGDLHARHLLIGAGGEPSGVIDWIDVCRADPAIDLPLYWAYLPPAGRATFHDAYGPVDDDALTRARVLAVSLWGALAEYAHDVGMPALLSEVLAGLERATEDLR